MTSKKVYYLLIAVLVAMGAVGVTTLVYGNKLLASSASKLNDAKLESRVIDEQQQSLAQAKQDIEKYADLEKIAKTVVPQEKDQARTVREIVKYAADAQVPVSSITFPTSDLGEKKTTAATTTAPLSQLKAVQGIKGVYQLEITVTNDAEHQVSYPSLINFLEKLEKNRRTAEVTTVGLQPDPKNRNMLIYTMTINVYLKP